MSRRTQIAQSTTPIDIKVAALLICVAEELRAEIERQIEPPGLSLLQMRLLLCLSYSLEEALSVRQLKAAIPSSNANVSRSLNSLVRLGLAEKHRSKLDQRVVYVRLTPEGQDAARKIIRVQGEFTLGLSREELSALQALLIQVQI